MYKFTNGVVVFDEKTKEEYVKAGLKLMDEPIAGQITIDEVIEEEINENQNNDDFKKRKSERSSKISK